MNDSQLAVFRTPTDLLGFLQKGSSAIESVLPKHLNAERMMRLATTSFSRDAKLRECSGVSIFGSLMVASFLGLEPGVDGDGYLIPYKGTCTFVPGWKGLVRLLNNAGKATTWTGAVYEGDDWEFQLGTEPRCNHKPGPEYGVDPDKMQWVYACGKIHGSETPIVEAWPMQRIWLHRDRFNKVGRSHYSFAHPEMYARKVVLLQVLKYLPRTVEVTNAIVASNATEIGMTTKIQDGVLIEAPIERTGDNGAPDNERPALENGDANTPADHDLFT